MSKWPPIEDRDWPEDMPESYFNSSKPHYAACERGLVIWALQPVLLGLIRRVEELERKMAHLMPDKSDDI